MSAVEAPKGVCFGAGCHDLQTLIDRFEKEKPASMDHGIDVIDAGRVESAAIIKCQNLGRCAAQQNVEGGTHADKPLRQFAAYVGVIDPTSLGGQRMEAHNA
jgi:hypothetical protein